MLEKKKSTACVNSWWIWVWIQWEWELFKHGANSHVRTGSLMLTARISKAQSLEWKYPWPPSFNAHCEGHFPLLDCPINQLPAGRGSFLVPVTTSDCLGGNTSGMSSSQQLIIIRTQAGKKKLQQKQVWWWITKTLCNIHLTTPWNFICVQRPCSHKHPDLVFWKAMMSTG